MTLSKKGPYPFFGSDQRKRGTAPFCSRETDYTRPAQKARSTSDSGRVQKDAPLQKSFLAREVVRNHRFGRQQDDARQQQVPPQTLAALDLLAGHVLPLERLRRDRRRMAGDSGHQLAGIDR